MFTRPYLSLSLLAVLLLTGCTVLSVNEEPNEALIKESTDRRNQIIRSVVIDHKKEILGCYAYETKKDPKTSAGKVVLEWDIDGDGHPENLSVEDAKSTLKIETLNKCLIDAFNEMQFPPPTRGNTLRIHYPLIFGDKQPESVKE